MSKRIVCPKCNAVIMWNEQDSVTQCRLCGTKYKMHPRSRVQNSVNHVFMPPAGRGQVDYLTVTNESLTRNRPIVETYIPKNWNYECHFLPERSDMISNPLVLSIVYSATDNSAKVFYASECFYKHFDLTPQTAHLEWCLDDFRVNRSRPSFLRLKSFMSANDYCNYLAQSTGVSQLSLKSQKNADNSELEMQRRLIEDFRSKGFSDVSAEWSNRTYRGINNSGSRIIVTSETRVAKMSKMSVIPTLQMMPRAGMFGMRMMPAMAQQQSIEYYWATMYELTLVCLESVYNRAAAEFDKINKSIKFLPGMEQARAEGIAMAQNALSGIAQNQAASMDRSSRIIAETNAYTSNIQHQMISDNAASHNRTANRYSEMIRDVNAYNTMGGGVVEASTQYDRVYQNTNNPNIFAAQQGTSLEFGVDFEELTRNNGDY